MKKTKKLLSMLTALAITASSFAAIALPASAATQFAYDFEASDAAAWTIAYGNTSYNGLFKNTIETDTDLGSKVYVLDTTTNVGGGRNATLTIPDDITASESNVVKVSFDWLQSNDNPSNGVRFTLRDNAGKPIFNVADIRGKVSFNGEETELENNKWYKIEATVDFDTKKILTAAISEGSAVKATFNQVAFTDSTANGIAQVYLDFSRASGQTTTSCKIRFDNFTATPVTTMFLATFNVKVGEKALKDADVKIGEDTYQTDDNGQVIIKLPNGTYNYEVSKTGFVTTDNQAKATGTVSDSSNTVNVTLKADSYTPWPAKVTVAGGQTMITAPTGEEPATSTAFTFSVKDQIDEDMTTDYTTEWNIYPTGTTTANQNVTIADGVVSVTKDFKAADGDVAVFDVVATASRVVEGETKSAQGTAKISITNSDIIFYGTEAYKAVVRQNTYGLPSDDAVIRIPDNGMRIALTWTKGAFNADTSKEAGQKSHGTLVFVDDSGNRVFGLQDTNYGLYAFTKNTTTVNVDQRDDCKAFTDQYSVKLGDTVRNTEYPIEMTILDNNLIVKFNGGEYNVIPFEESAPTKLKYIKVGSTQENGDGSSSGTGATNLVMSSKVNVDPTLANITGDNKFAAINGKEITRQYTAKAVVASESDSFTWSMSPASVTGITLDAAKGILTVTDELAADTDITLTATSGEKSGTYNVSVLAPHTDYDIEVEGPSTVQAGETAEYKVTKITDTACDDDVTEFFTPTWSIDGVTPVEKSATFTGITADAAERDAYVISAIYDSEILKTVLWEKVTIPANATEYEYENAPADATLYLWDSVSGMKPLSAKVTTAASEIPDGETAIIGSKTGVLQTAEDADNGDINIIVSLSDDIDDTVAVAVGTYSIVDDYAAGTIDISGIVDNDNITGYLVTVADAEGNKLGEQVTAKADAASGAAVPATLESGTPAKMEAAPVYAMSESTAAIPVPETAYNITVTATAGSEGVRRTDVYVNDQMIINNLNQGSDSFKVVGSIPSPADYTVKDVVISGGSAKLDMSHDNQRNGNKNTTVTVAFSKAPSIVNRTKKIYVIGDSLVAKYYDHENPKLYTVTGKDSEGKDIWTATDDGDPKLVREGWGEALKSYIQNADVINLGNSGAWAEGMLHDAFTAVDGSAQAGDILILESGYNDQDHSTVDAMKKSVKEMVTRAEAKGVTVFVVTPNSTIHSGSEYAGAVKYSSYMRETVTELQAAGSKAILIDLAANSSAYLQNRFGAATKDANGNWTIPAGVADKVYPVYNNVGDKLHSTLNAANCWAAIVAKGLYDNASTQSLVKTDYSYTFTDSEGEVTVNPLTIVPAAND